MIPRITFLSVCLLLGAAFIATASKSEQVPPRQSLAEFPMHIGTWTGQRADDFSADVLQVLGVDDYLNRIYVSPSGYTGLYIGYYQSQRQGDTMHSPLNCLPGAGWEPVSKSYLSIPVDTGDSGTRTISVNRYVVQKGLDRQVVLYWYQSHGRVVANEYRSKVLMVYDAARTNRTNAALVRVISPSSGADDQSEAKAGALAVDFVKNMFPLLGKYIPS